MKFARVNVRMVGIIGDRIMSGIVLMRKANRRKQMGTKKDEAMRRELVSKDTVRDLLKEMKRWERRLDASIKAHKKEDK